MAPDLRLRARAFLELAELLDHPDGDPAEAKRLRALADELLRVADAQDAGPASDEPPAEALPSGAPLSQERPPTPGVDLPAPAADKPEK